MTSPTDDDGSSNPYLILNAIPTPVSVWRRGEDGCIRFVFANAAAALASRRVIADLIGTELHIIYHDQPEVARLIALTLEDGTPRRIEHEYHVPTTDERRWIYRSFMRANPTDVVVNTEDVTTRHASDFRLAESEARFRGVFEQGSIAMSLTAFDGRLLRVNAAFCAMLGYREDELLASTFMALTHPDDVAADVANKDMLVAGAIPGYRMEKRFIHADGRTVWADLSARAVRGAAGEQLYLLAQMQDITTRKYAEALHAGERARLSDLLQRAPALICTMRGPTHIFEMANELYYQFIGRRDLIGKPIAEVLPELADQGFVDVLDRVLATGEPHLGSAMPVQIRRGADAPQSTHYVNIVYQAIEELDGTRSGIFVHGVDVTQLVDAAQEHERLVAELYEGRARLAAVLEQMPCAVIIGEAPSGRLVLGNQQVQRVFGHPLLRTDDITQYREWVGYHPDGSRVAAEAWPLARAISEGAVTWGQVVRYPRPDEPNAWIRLSAAPIRDRNGAVVAGVATVEDITAQMAIEAALRASQERHELVLQATNDLIYDWDVVSNSLFFNDALVTTFGHEPHTVRNDIAWWEAQIHPDDRAASTASLEASINSGARFWTSEYRFQRGDGSYASVLDRGHIIRSATGAPIRMIGSMADVTERRQLEAQLHEAQKMEAVGRLAGGVAHDFNNLLCAILGYADLALMETRESSLVRDEIQEIRKAAQRAAQLTKQLLAFGRRQIRRPTLIDVNALMRDTDRLLAQLLGEHIQLVTQASTPRAVVHMDPSELDQILVNLAVNARDSMVHGGSVTIETSRRLVPSATANEEPTDYVVLTVVDNGCGIDPETLPHIFEPFFTTKGDAGTGLGLSTVYGIVKQNGGQIEVESVVGEGTRFHVYLPAASGEEPSVEDPPREATVTTETATVLLAEDENGVRALAQRILERAGFRVFEARHGADAVILWDKHADEIDVLVTDLVMPEMGGRALAERLRQSRPALPVLFMSGYSDDETTRRGIADSRIAFLAKPFTAESLVSAVREVIRQRV